MSNRELLSNVPVTRNSDLVSSHDAEEGINQSGSRASQQYEILRLVEQHPGKTSLELSTICTLDRYQIARRLSDLHTSGHVTQGETRKCSVGNRTAVEWFPAMPPTDVEDVEEVI